MRGTLWVSVSERDGHGIIPAYAGNTLATCPIHLGTWDHPRVCGEHLQVRYHRGDGNGIIPAYAGNTSDFELFDAVDRGSSPRMRGTRHRRGEPLSQPGIIPAYAGNT